MIINFNEDSRTSFRAIIDTTAQKIIEQNLDVWEGQRIRVRGWVERRKGPTITVTQPEQIELLRHQPVDSATQKNFDK